MPWQDTGYAVDLCVLVQISPGNRFEMRDDGLIRHAGIDISNIYRPCKMTHMTLLNVFYTSI